MCKFSVDTNLERMYSKDTFKIMPHFCPCAMCRLNYSAHLTRSAPPENIERGGSRSMDVVYLDQPEKEEEESYNKTPGHASSSLGYRNYSKSFASVTIGKEAVSRLRTQVSHAAGHFVSPGDVQRTKTIMKSRNINKTSVFKIDSLDDYIIYGSSTSLYLKISIFGTNQYGVAYHSRIKCLVRTFGIHPFIKLSNTIKKVKFGPKEWDINLEVEAIKEDSDPEIITRILKITSIVNNLDTSKEVRWLATINAEEMYHD